MGGRLADSRLATIEGFLGKEQLRKTLGPVETKWEALFADARERCQANGVDHPQELPDEDFKELLGQADLIAIPHSELRPIDDLQDGGTQKE